MPEGGSLRHRAIRSVQDTARCLVVDVGRVLVGGSRDTLHCAYEASRAYEKPNTRF